jgi:hypothetical protein
MNLPGFTAEASLYKTSGHTYTAQTHLQTGGAVFPAQVGGL